MPITADLRGFIFIFIIPRIKKVSVLTKLFLIFWLIKKQKEGLAHMKCTFHSQTEIAYLVFVTSLVAGGHCENMLSVILRKNSVIDKENPIIAQKGMKHTLFFIRKTTISYDETFCLGIISILNKLLGNAKSIAIAFWIQIVSDCIDDAIPFKGHC